MVPAALPPRQQKAAAAKQISAPGLSLPPRHGRLTSQRKETMNGETMSTPSTRPAWPGVISAATIAVTLGALVICGQTHQGARQAAATPASAAIICPPPSGDGVVAMSKTGDPGC